jgi:hypothetical protein
LLLTSSMNSKAPGSIEEAILIIYGGNFEFKITVPITVNELSINIRLFLSFSKSMNLFWNAKTHTLSSFLIKPIVFLKIKDLKFFKIEELIDID